MKKRVKKYEETSPVEFLLLREKLGMKRYRKTTKRDEEKRKVLLELGLKKIEEEEKDDFIQLATEEGESRSCLQLKTYFPVSSNNFPDLLVKFI